MVRNFLLFARKNFHRYFSRCFLGINFCKYNNNTVFASIMNIYSPQFFIYGPPVLFNTGGPYNERLRAVNNHNAQIKQGYYYYNSLEGIVHFFVFFSLLSWTRLFKSSSPSSESWDEGKVIPISKDIFLFLISHSYFVLNSMPFKWVIIRYFENFCRNKLLGKEPKMRNRKQKCLNLE